jgi:serine/threonine protein kinase
VKLQRFSDGKTIVLGAELGSGGEGKIYEVNGEPSLVAKVYHQGKNTNEEKLKVMFANPPQDPTSSQNHVSISWTVDLLRTTNNQQIVGFLMGKATNMRPIHSFYTPKNRRQQLSGFNYLYLHRTARNLAAAIGALHARDYVIGDVNESNILVAETALITLVDTDSFQVRDPQNGNVHRCPVGKLEFTPPELQGKNFRDIDRNLEHDLFGLGVLIFQLLMEGTHPFEGIFQGAGEPPPKEIRISAGHFPYSQNVPYRPKPLAPSFNTVSPTLQKLFLQCFEDGYQDPKARPDAQTWRNALKEAENDLIICSTSNNHLYGNHLNACPWCERTVKLKGRDPFPEHQQIPLPPATTKPLKPGTSNQLPTPNLKPVLTNCQAAANTYITKGKQFYSSQLPVALNHCQKVTATSVTKGKKFYSSQLPIVLNKCKTATTICVRKGKQFYSSNKKTIKLTTLGLVSLTLTVFTVNFVSQEIEAAKIREQERQAAIKTEQERQADIKVRQERLAAEREERERLAVIKTEAERKEKERLAVIEGERVAKEAALKTEAERKERERLAALEVERKRQAAIGAESKKQAAIKAEQQRKAAIEAEQARQRFIQAERERQAANKAQKQQQLSSPPKQQNTGVRQTSNNPKPWESPAIRSNSEDLEDLIRRGR